MPADIRRATLADAELLSGVATRSYLENYPHLWDDGGAAYVARSFSRAALERELTAPDGEYYMIFAEGVPVGFLKLRPENTWPIFAGQKAFEIERIYLRKMAQGRGFGRALMLFSLDEAKRRGREVAWLKAMEKSAAAIRFYESFGFEKCGTDRLALPHIKPEQAGMVVMKRDLLQD